MLTAPTACASRRVHPEKAALAHAAAVREWDSNGTNFGYRKELGAALRTGRRPSGAGSRSQPASPPRQRSFPA